MRSLPFFSSAPSYRFLLFVLMMFFLFLADAMMSYYAPIIIEDTVKSSTLMGIILASSSVVGMATDFIFAHVFSQKRAFFFQRVLFLLVFLFPLSFFLSHNIVSFLIAMAGWGVSYEAMTFCTYHAIHEAVGRVHHAWAWGLVAILKNVALTIGPVLASSTLALSRNLPLYYAIIFNAVAVALFFAYLFIEKKKIADGDLLSLTVKEQEHRTLRETFQIWKTLDRILWPLLVLLILFFLFDSAVFSVGPLFTEHLKQQNQWGGYFVSLYGLPGIFVGFLLSTLVVPYGKKKLAFVTGIVGGMCAFVMGFSSSVTMILLTMFASSLGLAIMEPALVAVFEDLVARGENVANDLISMTALSSSFSYIVGPILNGYLNDRFGELVVFELWGGLIFIWSAWLFWSYPRKVHLPQKQIGEIIQNS